MTEPCYSFRANAFTPLRTYRLGSDALFWTSGGRDGRVGYGDVVAVRLSRGLMRGEAVVKSRTMQRLTLRSRSGEQLMLSPLNYVHFRRWEDRSATYAAFIDQLLGRLRHANPDLAIVTAFDWELRARHAVTRAMPSLLGRIGRGLLYFTRAFGYERAGRIASRLLRTLGPWLPAHRVAMANLKAAFPEKSDGEIERILQGIWDNFGRIVAEYAFLDELSDYDPHDTEQKLIVFDEDTRRRVFDVASLGKPVLFFSAHTGNWELFALAVAFGIPLAAVYRPFKSAALDDMIKNMRRRVTMIPAQFGAAAEVDQALQQGTSIGLFVDQHFTGGTDVVFFGRPCKVNPTLAKLARKHEYPIYGARAIRLPGGRFQGDLTHELQCPRDPEGKIDVTATMQMITAIVEGWVRDHPEQWLWLHRRWR
jgi:Kdo2-lipid IVA lauroyltransferase/acyltransferase